MKETIMGIIQEESNGSDFVFQFSLDGGEYNKVLKNIQSPKKIKSDSEQSNQKSYICEICGKNLKSAGSLICHKRIHSGHRIFKCKECPKSFVQKVGLEKHELIHKGIYNFSCHICDKKFRQKQSIQKHLAHRHQLGPFNHFCPVCDKGFADTGSLNIHSVIHDEYFSFECSVCSQKFKHKSSQVRHEKTHSKATICTLCPVPKKFRYEVFLQRHLKLTHNVELAEIEHEKEMQEIPVENQQALDIQEQPIQIVQMINDQEQILLELREEEIQNIPDYLENFTTVQSEFLDFDGVVEEVAHQIEEQAPEPISAEVPIVSEMTKISNEQLQEKTVNRGILEFECHLCQKQFSKKYYLNRHIKTHDRLPSTVCYICGKSLKSAMNLHMKAVHENYRPFRCDICDKTFREKNRLRLHMMVHTDIAPLKCEICQKSFRHLQNLKNHMYKHTGYKRFKCSICSKAFIEKGSLKSHMIIHQPEKKFQCEICLIMIRRKHSYEKHIKTCRGALITNCVECKKTFRYESFLKQHLEKKHPHQTSNPYYKKLFFIENK